MIRFKLSDCTGRLVSRVTDNWLLSIRETNPAILDMLRDRDLRPARHLNPWSGEFAGKYLTGCALIYRLTRDSRLKKYVTRFIAEMLTYQEPNGYIGAFDSRHQLTGTAEFMRDPVHDRTVDSIPTWDAWSNYHIMTGLMLWHDITKESVYLNSAERIAGLFIDKFYRGDGQKITDTGSCEMNLAVYHGFAMLYRRTGKRIYLDFALKAEEDITDPRAGNYMKYAQDGVEFYKCPKPRWESLHIIMGYAEMYRATGDKKYLDAVTRITYSILGTDVHNTGGFSTNEQAIGSPFSYGAIETCCVVAFNALAADVYRLTSDMALADFLELSLYNAVMGSFSPSGRWSTYDTPMDGCKRANYHSIVFQSRPGSPDLNCCSVNAPRGLGELAGWAVHESQDITYVNWYGTAAVDTGKLRFRVSGNYPYDNEVDIEIEASSGEKTAFRIPAWSDNTAVKLNGCPVDAAAGKYLVMESLSAGDRIKIVFDFTPRLLYGGGDRTGCCSVYRGPLLLGYDSAENPSFDFDAVPAVSLDLLKNAAVSCKNDSLKMTLDNGVVLSDFYNLGRSGSAYRTWLPI
jgi:DUF1680 family protein